MTLFADIRSLLRTARRTAPLLLRLRVFERIAAALSPCPSRCPSAETGAITCALVPGFAFHGWFNGADHYKYTRRCMDSFLLGLSPLGQFLDLGLRFLVRLPNSHHVL